jgi:hypothetical protein
VDSALFINLCIAPKLILKGLAEFSRSRDELELTAVFSSVFMECAHRTLFKSKLKIDLPVEFRRRIFHLGDHLKSGHQ